MFLAKLPANSPSTLTSFNSDDSNFFVVSDSPAFLPLAEPVLTARSNPAFFLVLCLVNVVVTVLMVMVIINGVWVDRFSSWDGNVFPFTFDLNVTEPGEIDRWFAPVDVVVDFNFAADLGSVRVLEDHAGALLEIPSQLYKAETDDGYVTKANLVFLSSIGDG